MLLIKKILRMFIAVSQYDKKSFETMVNDDKINMADKINREKCFYWDNPFNKQEGMSLL